MRTLRAAGDVSGLPVVTFGHRSMMWWGTVGFVVIEGTSLLICGASYFYLHRHFASWPPEPIPTPALAVPTVQVLLMLAEQYPDDRGGSGCPAHGSSRPCAVAW